MTFDTVEIEFENGRRRTFPSSDFDYYAGTNELEHKSENMIISLSSLEKSFVYEMDEKTYEESIKDVIFDITYTQLKPQLKPEYKLLLDSLLEDILPLSEIKLKPQLKPLYGDKSNTFIKDKLIHPMMNLGLVGQTHPDKPTSPKQKYYLTDLGKALQQLLLKG